MPRFALPLLYLILTMKIFVLQHSIQCGAGTGMFLLVNSSTVVVIRGPRATLWGSIYLDDHGEEDRELKYVYVQLDIYVVFYEKKVLTVMINNSTIISKMNNCL
jgi:hypothetical protein